MCSLIIALAVWIFTPLPWWAVLLIFVVLGVSESMAEASAVPSGPQWYSERDRCDSETWRRIDYR